MAALGASRGSSPGWRAEGGGAQGAAACGAVEGDWVRDGSGGWCFSTNSDAAHHRRPAKGAGSAVFSFLYLKKIKISKIYVCFGKFQKYTPVAL